MQNTSVFIVPVVIGTLGIVKKGQADTATSLPGSYSIQKTVLLGLINGKVLNTDKLQCKLAPLILLVF